MEILLNALKVDVSSNSQTSTLLPCYMFLPHGIWAGNMQDNSTVHYSVLVIKQNTKIGKGWLRNYLLFIFCFMYIYLFWKFMKAIQDLTDPIRDPIYMG